MYAFMHTTIAHSRQAYTPTIHRKAHRRTHRRTHRYTSAHRHTGGHTEDTEGHTGIDAQAAHRWHTERGHREDTQREHTQRERGHRERTQHTANIVVCKCTYIYLGLLHRHYIIK